VSNNTAPYVFVEGDNLIVIMDNIPDTDTYNIPMDYDGTLTGVTSTTVFAASGFITVFEEDDFLNDFYLVMTSGANTQSLDADAVADQGGDTWRFTFDSIPVNFGDFIVGDVLKVEGMTNSGNNGTFIISAKSDTPASEYIEVSNVNGVAESASNGTAIMQARRQISDYTQVSGTITLLSALPQSPSTSDTFIVLPYTLKNLEAFMNNLRVSTLSTVAEITSVEGNTKLQIASLLKGSDGYIQVTGGTANAALDFNTSLVRGLQGYAKYTGLLEEVHKTIYGDDTDSIAYEGVGAAGIRFEIKAPTIEEHEFNIDVTLQEGISISTVEDEIKNAVTGYVNTLDIGDSVILAEIIDRVMDVNGIIDMRILSPTSNIIIQENELARTSDSLITIG
jgi:hypothetical protein